MTRNTSKDEGARAYLRPPLGNSAFYSREYLSNVRTLVLKAWPASGPHTIKREVALTLLADPELRLRVCHLEEILRGRQLAARQQVNGCLATAGSHQNGCHASSPSPQATTQHANCSTATSHHNSSPPHVQLQTALADPSFAALFELDRSVNEPDWGMQVLWLNMAQLQKELGLPPSPSSPLPPPSPPQPTTASSYPLEAATAIAARASTVTAPGGSPAASPTPTPTPPMPSPPAMNAPTPEPSLLQAVLHAFPNHPTDDGDYLAIAAAFCLGTRRDPKSLLPALSLHLTDLTAYLCAYAAADGRLAAVLQRMAAAWGAGGGATAPLPACVSEFLAGARTRLVFRQSESLSRKGERVVSMALEQLARNGAAAVAAATATAASNGYGGGVRSPFAAAAAGLPLDVWQRAAAAVAAAATTGVASGGRAVTGAAPGAGGKAPGGDGLPVFLFEYEAPEDLSYGKDNVFSGRGDPQAAMSVVRASPASSSGGAAGGGGFDGYSRSPPPASPAAGGVNKTTPGDFAGPNAATQHPQAPPQLAVPLQQQQQQRMAPPLHHAWSDSLGTLARSAPNGGNNPAAAAAATTDRIPAQPYSSMSALHPAASEPAPLPDAVAMAAMTSGLSPPAAPTPSVFSADALPRRMTEPSAVALGAGAGGAGGGGMRDFPGLASLGAGLGFADWPGGGKAAPAAEGGSFGGSYPGGPRRLPLYDDNAAATAPNRAVDTLLQHSLATAAAAEPALAPGGGGGILSASPGGPGGELHVPQEIAEVWSNAGLGSFGTVPGMAIRRNSVAAVPGPLPSPSTLAGDTGAMGGVFAMSPSHESSYIWERVAGRSATQPGINGTATAAAAAAANRPGTVDLGAFALSGGTGAGGPLFPDGASHDGSGGGGFLVGSAPPGAVPPFLYGGLNGGAAAAAAAAFPGGSGGGGGGLMDYAPWPSSAADLSGSVGGRSPQAEDLANGSWLLAHGPRIAGGCGGVTAAGRMLAAVASAAAGAVEGPGGRPGGGAAGVVTAASVMGPSPSVSEESEEAASVMGGLELDPVAMTLEFIGFDRMDPGSGTAVQGKGLIAAAAAPKSSHAATAAGTLTPPSVKSFTSGASTNSTVNGIIGNGGSGACVNGINGNSPHSSLDSCDALQGGAGAGASGGVVPTAAAVAGGGGLNAATAAVLTSWSAMAARGPALPTSAAAGAPGMQHLAAAAAAAGGGRLVGAGSTAVVVQGLAATMAAMGAVGVARSGSLAGAAGAAGALGLNPGSILGVPALQAGAGVAGAVAGRDVFSGKALHPKLTQRVREEIFALVRSVPGLKPEDFDDGVLHQLTLKKSEDEAVGALRTLAAENLSGIQHMAAYINHIIKNYHLTGGNHGSGTAGLAAASLPSATVRANSTPVSSKAILQKLPLRVYRRLEEVINKCSHMEWKHFDAGVVKVMAQLAEIGEEDVFEELELLKSTDLSNVEYMPAYLNKRLNNRLWARRKMLTSAAASASSGPAAGAGP